MDTVSAAELFVGGLVLSAVAAHVILGKFIPKPKKNTGVVSLHEVVTRIEHVSQTILKPRSVTITCPRCHRLITV